MPIVPLKCKNCGAVLKASAEKDSLICPFWDTYYYTYQAMSQENDFEVIAGTLVKYHGSSVNPEIPSSVSVIGTRSFTGSTIRQISIPFGVKEIGAYAFADCKDLERVLIPDSVTHIGARAFFRCFSLNNISLPSSDFACPYGDNYPFLGTPSYQQYQKELQTQRNSILRAYRLTQNHCPDCGTQLLFGKCSNCGYSKPKG